MRAEKVAKVARIKSCDKSFFKKLRELNVARKHLKKLLRELNVARISSKTANEKKESNLMVVD